MSKNKFLNYIFGEATVGGTSNPRDKYQSVMDRVFETSFDYLINDDTKMWHAVCVSNATYGSGIETDIDSRKIETDGGNFYDIKIHRPEIEGRFFKQPYGPNISSDQERKDIIKMHPYARSEVGLESQPNWSDIVLVKEELGGRLTFVTTYRKATATMTNTFNAEAKNLDYDKKMGDYGPPPVLSDNSTTEEFLIKLRNSPHFYGFSGAALAGIAVNAHQESNYQMTVGGDSVSDFGGTRGDRAIKGYGGWSKGKTPGTWCSWGYWQFNICPASASGTRWLNEKGIDVTKEEGKKRWIDEFVNKENEQFLWVAKELIRIGLNIQTSDPYDFGYYMTTKFERPADKEKKGKKRGNLAKSIYNKYKNILEAPPGQAFTIDAGTGLGSGFVGM